MTNTTSNANMKLFETTNRNLENFLYMHKITFSDQKKMEDGTTCWIYRRTEKFERVFREYMELRHEKITA